MNRLVCSLLFVCHLALLGRSAEFKFSNHTFTVPDGFVVEQAAGPPLVDRPISADFDEQGRLYVSDSSGSNDKVEKQLQDKPHRVVRLQDVDGDGRFDRSVVFADKLMFPEGVMWFDGSLYVAAPPSIWKLTDTDGDGVADQRVEWFQGKTLTGCANDLHGPFPGPDGWIYWCKGAFAKQTYERPGQSPFVTRAAHTFRSRPDGSGLEPVFTAGMDNPVWVAFTPGGERILAGTFFQHPEAGQRDGLIHAIYGGVYGKSHDVLDGHKRTGDLMPVLTHLGAAAPCSLRRYRSRAFGDEYQDSLFACLFNLHKVTRHVLESIGATFKTLDSDFLVSDNTDFHPTDVLEDADGSLLVIDTGGWYKLCCPTSQLAKPDVLGALYRIRRSGAPKIDDLRGLKLAWPTMSSADLAKLLGDDRPAVRDQAIHQLGKQGSAAVPALVETLAKAGSAAARRNVVWALTRLGGEIARQAVRSAFSDKNDSVRQAAIHSASVWRDAGAVVPLLSLLNSHSAHVQRAAAEALGRMGDKRAVTALLAAAEPPRGGTPIDRVLEHSLIYALIEIADREGTERGLQSSSSRTRRAALIALDQMDGGGLKATHVAPLLASTDPILRQTASWIAGHHPEWGQELAGFFRRRLAATNLSDPERAELQQQLAQFARDASIQELIAATLGDTATPVSTRRLLLHAMAQASLQATPGAWPEVLRQALADTQEPIVRAAVATIRSWPVAKTNAADFSSQLTRIARDTARPADLRLEALAAISGGLATVEPAIFDLLRAGLDPAQPLLRRNAAATVMGRARLDEAQLLSLINLLPSSGPLEISKLLGAFEQTTNETIGLRFVAALRGSKGLAGLRADLLKPRLEKFPASVQEQGKELLALLEVDAEKQRAHLEELALSLKGGDIRRGQALFNSAKAACVTCHAIGYLGGKVGPDLTTIGQIRTERDLLEAIVYPSASFVRSYEPMVVVTRSGEDYSGVLRRDSPEEVLLVTGPEAEVRIARADITEMRPGAVSVMPGGLDEQLSRQELADLVAFLKGTKWGAQ
ncbi:MAG: PVC-type heme-binding CxxCH protein [Verrucomicrobiota bacterium]